MLLAFVFFGCKDTDERTVASTSGSLKSGKSSDKKVSSHESAEKPDITIVDAGIILEDIANQDKKPISDAYRAFSVSSRAPDVMLTMIFRHPTEDLHVRLGVAPELPSLMRLNFDAPEAVKKLTVEESRDEVNGVYTVNCLYPDGHWLGSLAVRINDAPSGGKACQAIMALHESLEGKESQQTIHHTAEYLSNHRLLLSTPPGVHRRGLELAFDGFKLVEGAAGSLIWNSDARNLLHIDFASTDGATDENPDVTWKISKPKAGDHQHSIKCRKHDVFIGKLIFREKQSENVEARASSVCFKMSQLHDQLIARLAKRINE